MAKTRKVKRFGPTYGPITFPEGYNKTFAEFKADFQDAEFFKEMFPIEREKRLKEAHKIATNGNLSATTEESKGGK